LVNFRFSGLRRAAIVWAFLPPSACKVDDQLLALPVAADGGYVGNSQRDADQQSEDDSRNEIDSQGNGGPSVDSGPRVGAPIDSGSDADATQIAPHGDDAGNSAFDASGLDDGATACLHGAVGDDERGCAPAPGSSALRLEPMAPPFGSVVVGGASQSIPFTISNAGDQPSTPLTTTILGEFSIVADGCNDVVLAGHATCTIRVTFLPVDPPASNKTGSLTVSDAIGNMVSTSLSGRGLSVAQLTIDRMSAQLSAEVGTSASQMFTVTNAGEAPSGTVAISRLPAAASDFSVDSNTCAALAGGEMCTIVVGFRPSTTGPRAATLNVAASPGGSLTTGLTGDAFTPPAVTLVPATTANFGDVALGNTRDLAFVLTNTGSQAAESITGSVTGTGFSVVTQTGDCGQTLAGGTNCTLHVRYTPAGLTGSVGGSLFVTPSNAAATPPVQLTANAFGIVAIPTLQDVTWQFFGAMNPSGTVVVGTVNTTMGSRGFYWPVGSPLITLITSPTTALGGYLYASGVNAAGTLVTGCAGTAWTWSPTAGISDIGGPFFNQNTCLYTIDATGKSMVGFASDDMGNNFGVAWRNGGFEILRSDFPRHAAFSKSDSGIIVGVGYNPIPETPAEVALIWNPDGAPTASLPAVPLPAGSNSSASAISADGSIVVGGIVDSVALVWRAPFLQNPDALPGLPNVFASHAENTNQDGSAVAGWNTFGGVQQAVLWTMSAEQSATVQLINATLAGAGADVSAFTLNDAKSVSNDGKIVAGDGTFNGIARPWIARLP
jgi:hypothetical protein